jgi:hypothetical protein
MSAARRLVAGELELLERPVTATSVTLAPVVCHPHRRFRDLGGVLDAVLLSPRARCRALAVRCLPRSQPFLWKARSYRENVLSQPLIPSRLVLGKARRPTPNRVGSTDALSSFGHAPVPLPTTPSGSPRVRRKRSDCGALRSDQGVRSISESRAGKCSEPVAASLVSTTVPAGGTTRLLLESSNDTYLGPHQSFLHRRPQ